VVKPGGKKPLVRRKYRWEVNIEMDHIEISLEDTNWIDVAYDWDKWRVAVNTKTNL
jgi:hypothetical protein